MSVSRWHQLSRLSQSAARAVDVGSLLEEALPLVLDITEAVSASVVRHHLDASTLVAHCGSALTTQDLAPSPTHRSPGWHDVIVPSEWERGGVRCAFAHGLDESGSLVLTLAYLDESAPDDLLDVVGAVMVAAVRRIQAQADLADLTQRVNNAQSLANMGDYDWHITTDTNRWSDQLYRIYGHEPQSFNASYERFISHIHPDDRERIMAVHQRAYASGEPYQMIERVARPDGETRYLSSNGQVIMDETGTPVRMRGTCIDITDLVLAEQQAERASARFRALVESSRDAIMVLAGPQVVQTNDRGRDLLGGDPVGLPLERFVAVDGSESLGVPGRTLDGHELVLDVFSSELNPGIDDDLVAVFVRDAQPRLASEALAMRMRETQVRRRQAVEINDNIIQGLTASVYSLELDDVPAAADYLRLTLASARAMMSDLMDPLDSAEPKPGDLVRQCAATLSEMSEPAVAQEAGLGEHDGAVTDWKVLIVDDCVDMRMLVRLFLERRDGVRVVGEAGNGRLGIQMARELQPDLVLLDLAMPEMDGLEALPDILTAAPAAKVIVLSGFDQRIGKQALAAGATQFVQKGGGLEDLMRAVDSELAPQRAPCSSTDG